MIDVPNMDWIWASHVRYMDFTHECGFTEESLIEVLKPQFQNIQISYEDTSYNNEIYFVETIFRGRDWYFV